MCSSLFNRKEQSVLRKRLHPPAAARSAKDGLLQDERWPFTRQKTAFYAMKGRLLQNIWNFLQKPLTCNRLRICFLK